MIVPKKVLLIGNRAGLLDPILRMPTLELVRVFALTGSRLEAALAGNPVPATSFRGHEKTCVVEEIQAADYDLLVSNGCPFILPISSLRRPGRLYLNVHPGHLPEGRGRHPVNAAILLGSGGIGATLHHMDDGIDTGWIIHQECIELTNDLDLELAYHIAFELEARVFTEGMRRLAAARYDLPGSAPSGAGSYYTRRIRDQWVDVADVPDKRILLLIRAFGTRSQGVFIRTNQGILRAFEGERILNPHLLEQYAGRDPGDVVLRYGERLLLKTREGLVKIKAFEFVRSQPPDEES